MCDIVYQVSNNNCNINNCNKRRGKICTNVLAKYANGNENYKVNLVYCQV